MPNYCVAFGCSNTSSKPGISCFRFPKDSVLKKKWTEQVRRTSNKLPEGPSKNSVVCSEHFTQDCFDAIWNEENPKTEERFHSNYF